MTSSKMTSSILCYRLGTIASLTAPNKTKTLGLSRSHVTALKALRVLGGIRVSCATKYGVSTDAVVVNLGLGLGLTTAAVGLGLGFYLVGNLFSKVQKKENDVVILFQSILLN